MPLYVLAVYATILLGMGLFLPFWWKRGNVHRENFGNWHKRSWSERYMQGRPLSIAAAYVMFCDGFLLVVVSNFIIGNGHGVLNAILLVSFGVLLLSLFACFGLCLTVMFFKWPQFLVPPWARDGKVSKKSRK